jgi:lycopene beta-cyclase
VSPEHASGNPSFDYALAGGGLQAALLVLAIRDRHPDARIALLERSERLGGNHTWCFHSGDVSAKARGWIQPLVSHSWEGYEVRFPGFERSLDDPYSCILPEQLDAAVEAALLPEGSALYRATEVAELSPTRILSANGQHVEARLVLDARGPGALPREGTGFQKFVGLEVELEQPHGLERPLLMDATVDQADGFRFMYVLPLGPRRLLVEDTRFANDATIDSDACRARIHAYCARRDWTIADISREEVGILPMPWTGATPEPRGGVLTAGYRGDWFHPATGYSLPVAARLAQAVADGDPDDIRARGMGAFWREHRRQRNYCQFLNRMLFRWYPPEMRWRVFARFYRMPIPLIRRFYAMQLSVADRTRLLVGRPPGGLSARYRLAQGGNP